MSLPGRPKGEYRSAQHEGTPVSARRLALPSIGSLAAGVVLAGCAALPLPAAAEATAWLGSWTASPQPVWGPDFAFPTTVPALLREQTLRQVARISLGGRRLRVVLSNEYGSRPLRIAAARIAQAGAGSAVVEGSDRALTFGGQAAISVPPGAPVISDPVDLPVAALARVAVSLYFGEAAQADTFHWDGRQTAYLADGNRVSAARLDGAATTGARLFLGAIQVEADPSATAVAVIGDSITDGNGATMDADSRWPDFLATRLAPRRVAVLNAGISGARLLGDRMGVNALARFERDVLGQPGVRSVIVLLGINDIAWPGTHFDPQAARPSAEALIAAYRQLIARAHARGLRILGATLTPFEGALPGTPLDNYYQPEKDALRERINAWIRGSGEFDAVLDFDRLLSDPSHPARLLPAFDSGDHLHPGDHGNRAMAEAVELGLLLPPRAAND